MKINSDEKLALEFFELEDNFSKKQYKRTYDTKIKNKYNDALVSGRGVSDIEKDIDKYNEIIELYLFKRKCYKKMKDWYFDGIEKIDSSLVKYIIDVNYSNNYLLDKDVILDLELLLDTFYKRLSFFTDLIMESTTKDDVVKHFGDFVAIMEIDINNYKNGKLAIKARLINDFKDKVRSNFEKGSSNYQYMISNYFTKLLGSKNSDECLRIYNMAMMEIKLFTMDNFRVKER